MNAHRFYQIMLRVMLLVTMASMVAWSSTPVVAKTSAISPHLGFIEAQVMYQTSLALSCIYQQQTCTENLMIKDPQYTLTHQVGKESNRSLTLERFASSKAASWAFTNVAPSALTPVFQGFFHDYPAKAWQLRTTQGTTYVHAWVAESWLIVATGFDMPQSQVGCPLPSGFSETLYETASKYGLFP